MRRGAAGFSLLEVAVALAVTGIALLLAAGMLRTARGMIQTSGRALVDGPTPEIFTERLRADIEGATSILSLSGRSSIGRWQSVPLEVSTLEPPGRIRYELVQGDLMRALLDGTGNPVYQRRMLDKVLRFRWRAVSLRLLQIETQRFQEADPNAGDASRPWMDTLWLGTEGITVALRGSGLGRGY